MAHGSATNDLPTKNNKISEIKVSLLKRDGEFRVEVLDKKKLEKINTDSLFCTSFLFNKVRNEGYKDYFGDFTEEDNSKISH